MTYEDKSLVLLAIVACCFFAFLNLVKIISSHSKWFDDKLTAFYKYLMKVQSSESVWRVSTGVVLLLAALMVVAWIR